MSNDADDADVETLLNLNGWTQEVGGGFWLCIKVFRVRADIKRPHGINYSLTMHRPGGSRILGYDNAHYPKIKGGPSARSERIARGFDHRHFRDGVTWYDFRSPVKLLEDFWADVEAIMKQEGVRWQ